MRIGVLGTGVVGTTIATKLIELGHEVKMGARAAGGDRATAWAGENGDYASQGTFTDARVVKSLNTVTADVMVDPSRVPGEHVIFVASNDASAKEGATELLGEFGWPGERVIDVGDISGARATEAYLHIWLRLMGAVGHPHFNIAVERGS